MNAGNIAIATVIGSLPTFVNNQMFCTDSNYWAPSKAALGISNFADPWKIIIKVQFPNVGDKSLKIMIDSPALNTHSTKYIRFRDVGSAGTDYSSSTLTLANPITLIPSSFYEDGNPHFIVISRRTNPNETDIHIYNQAYTSIWSNNSN